MRKAVRTYDKIVYSREAIQKEIRQKYGMLKIRQYENRLCANCQRHDCHLFPITSEGEDCPYFEQIGVRT